MHKPQQQVREFHKAFIYPTSPDEVKVKSPELRAKLILEEAIETVEALVGTGALLPMLMKAHNDHMHRDRAPDLVEVLDGMCDLLYVTYGTAEDIGIDLEPFFDEVHRSNMAKAGGEKRADGKMQKPAGWTPPDLVEVLRRVILGQAAALARNLMPAPLNDESQKVLCCAECEGVLRRLDEGGFYCDNCKFAPSMQDTFLRDLPEGAR